MVSKEEIEKQLDEMTEDEIETLIDLIRLDLAGEGGEGFKAPYAACGACTGDAGCC